MRFIILCLVFCLISCGQNEQLSEKQSSNPIIKTTLKDCYNVGILMIDGVYNTELTAPYDIFQHTVFREGIKPMCVFTVADKSTPIQTFEGLKILADYNFLTDEIPNIDILVIPSAEHNLDSDLENTKLIEWVKKTGNQAQYVTSHCDGAFVLAKAGLLDSVVCTTFPSDIQAMRNMFPHLDIREDIWFVHDKNIITSAGGARSFEAAMYLCHVLYGQAVTERLGKGLVLDWDLEKIPHLVID